MIDKSYPLAGLCYVLSEAFYHMHPNLNLRPVRARYYGMCHWWLEDQNGRVIDFTAGQYTKPFPYHKGVPGGFLTKQPSKRTQEIIRVLEANHD
jgi:hypothetical protein